jgi:hypothetical protein
VAKKLPAGRVCFTCGCEFKVGAFDLHPYGLHCTHGARDRLLIACWFAKRHPEMLDEEIRLQYETQIQMSEEDFMIWLMEFQPAIYLWNNLKMFGDMMSWRIRFNEHY